MFSSQAAELSLDAPCRVCTSVQADLVDNRFLVGSSSVVRNSAAVDDNNSSNHLYATRFHPEVNELGLDASFVHPTGPVQSIACSPSNVTLVATSTQQQNNATLWKLDEDVMRETGGIPYHDDDDADLSGGGGGGGGGDPADDTALHTMALQQQQQLERGGGGSEAFRAAPKAHMEAQTLLTTESGRPVSHMAWRQPSLEVADPIALGASSSGDLLTVDTLGRVQQWDVEFGQAVASAGNLNQDNDTNNQMSPLRIPPRVAWDPHGGGAAAAVSNGTSRVSILDWRTSSTTGSGAMGEAGGDLWVGTADHVLAHRSAGGIRRGVGGTVDLDYNPNKPFVLATAGADGRLQFWDLRNAKQPILTCRGGHSHWVWNVKFNPFHDQLVLSTGSSDAVANLWRISSISSAPLMLDSDNDDDKGLVDRRVETFEHATSDACYGAAWGSADAWVYTTVGYEGKVVLHHVPSKEKYKILL